MPGIPENPYAPPSAKVADAPAPDVPKRPREVRLALALLWIALCAQFPEAVADTYSESPGEDYSSGDFLVYVVGAIAVVLAVLGGLLFCVGLGLRWARILYAAIVVLSSLTIIGDTADSFAQGIWAGLFFVAHVACDAVGLVLLFLPASNAWFRVARATRAA